MQYNVHVAQSVVIFIKLIPSGCAPQASQVLDNDLLEVGVTLSRGEKDQACIDVCAQPQH